MGEYWELNCRGGAAIHSVGTRQPSVNQRLLLAPFYLNHLVDVHAAVTRQGPSWRQIIGTQESGDDAVLVYLPDGGAVHKINQAILVHSDACWHPAGWSRREGRSERGNLWWHETVTFLRCVRLYDSVDGTRWIHVLSLPPYYSGHCKKHIFQ